MYLMGAHTAPQNFAPESITSYLQNYVKISFRLSEAITEPLRSGHWIFLGIYMYNIMPGVCIQNERYRSIHLHRNH